MAKLDVDQNPETAAAQGISSIPTVLIFRGGQAVDRITGLQPRARYERALEAAGATPEVVPSRGHPVDASRLGDEGGVHSLEIGA